MTACVSPGISVFIWFYNFISLCLSPSLSFSLFLTFYHSLSFCLFLSLPLIPSLFLYLESFILSLFLSSLCIFYHSIIFLNSLYPCMSLFFPSLFSSLSSVFESLHLPLPLFLCLCCPNITLLIYPSLYLSVLTLYLLMCLCFLVFTILNLLFTALLPISLPVKLGISWLRNKTSYQLPFKLL